MHQPREATTCRRRRRRAGRPTVLRFQARRAISPSRREGLHGLAAGVLDRDGGRRGLGEAGSDDEPVAHVVAVGRQPRSALVEGPGIDRGAVARDDGGGAHEALGRATQDANGQDPLGPRGRRGLSGHPQAGAGGEDGRRLRGGIGRRLGGGEQPGSAGGSNLGGARDHEIGGVRVGPHELRSDHLRCGQHAVPDERAVEARWGGAVRIHEEPQAGRSLRGVGTEHVAVGRRAPRKIESIVRLVVNSWRTW